eukprot:4975958-Prymnesium_polylepis.1
MALTRFTFRAPLCRLRDTPYHSETACPSTDTAVLPKRRVPQPTQNGCAKAFMPVCALPNFKSSQVKSMTSLDLTSCFPSLAFDRAEIIIDAAAIP